MKKRAIALLAVLCLLPALAGCGGEPSGKTDAPQDSAGSAGVEVELTEPITISFWHGIVQEDMQKTLAEIVDKFNNGIGKEMGITVESFAQGEMPDLENAVTAAIKAGNTPNVSLTEAAAAANWLQADCMVDLTPYIENENYGLDLDDYYDVYIQDSRSYAKPGYYTLPQYVGGEVMYYNADFFSEHNLTPPATWAEFEDVCRQITAITGKPAAGWDEGVKCF